MARSSEDRELAELLERYRPMIHLLAYRASRRATGLAELEDFLSIARTALWRAWRSYDPTRGASLSTWLWRKMVSATHDEVRRLTRIRSNGPDHEMSRRAIATVPLEECTREFADPSPGPEDLCAQHELEELLGRVLTTSQFECLSAYFLAGETDRAIGQRRGVTDGRIHQIRMAALRKVRLALEHRGRAA